MRAVTCCHIQFDCRRCFSLNRDLVLKCFCRPLRQKTNTDEKTEKGERMRGGICMRCPPPRPAAAAAPTVLQLKCTSRLQLSSNHFNTRHTSSWWQNTKWPIRAKLSKEECKRSPCLCLRDAFFGRYVVHTLGYISAYFKARKEKPTTLRASIYCQRLTMQLCCRAEECEHAVHRGSRENNS